eukprot:8407651-Alexandrium_andersonii.AAC.1
MHIESKFGVLKSVSALPTAGWKRPTSLKRAEFKLNVLGWKRLTSPRRAEFRLAVLNSTISFAVQF